MSHPRRMPNDEHDHQKSDNEPQAFVCRHLNILTALQYPLESRKCPHYLLHLFKKGKERNERRVDIHMVWLKGWTPVVESSSVTTSSSSSKFDDDEFHLVVKELQRRDIYVQDGDGSVFLLVLDRLSSPWLTVRGARKLLCPGVRLHVTGRVVAVILANEDESSDVITSDTANKDTTLNKKQLQLVASSLVMTAALPASPYIARLLSCPVGTLGALFPSDNEIITTEPEYEDAASPPFLSSLAYVLQPLQMPKAV